jgi:23S rRNA (cytidine1920-2'-O)/16S rRNA (cytidine1409-2'-O)-methyltransferase
MDRIDNTLVKRNLISSRTRAIYEIKNGNVLVNDKVIVKPSKIVKDEDNIIIKNKLNYVSKGALKLVKAIDKFNIILKNKVLLDIGSSTGGFTDVALRNDIKKVIAVDVGKDQFNEKLKEDKRVELYEQTDIRSFTPKDKVDIVTIDISFISVLKIIDKLKEISPNEILLLIKPQFECGKEISDKYKGIPLDKSVHYNVINNIINSFNKEGFYIQNLTYSPIRGGSGNIEYLGYFSKEKTKEIDINGVIKKAF